MPRSGYDLTDLPEGQGRGRGRGRPGPVLPAPPSPTVPSSSTPPTGLGPHTCSVPARPTHRVSPGFIESSTGEHVLYNPRTGRSWPRDNPSLAGALTTARPTAASAPALSMAPAPAPAPAPSVSPVPAPANIKPLGSNFSPRVLAEGAARAVSRPTRFPGNTLGRVLIPRPVPSSSQASASFTPTPATASPSRQLTARPSRPAGAPRAITRDGLLVTPGPGRTLQTRGRQTSLASSTSGRPATASTIDGGGTLSQREIDPLLLETAAVPSVFVTAPSDDETDIDR